MKKVYSDRNLNELNYSNILKHLQIRFSRIEIIKSPRKSSNKFLIKKNLTEKDFLLEEENHLQKIILKTIPQKCEIEDEYEKLLESLKKVHSENQENFKKYKYFFFFSFYIFYEKNKFILFLF